MISEQRRTLGSPYPRTRGGGETIYQSAPFRAIGGGGDATYQTTHFSGIGGGRGDFSEWM